MEKDIDNKGKILLIDPPWYRLFGQQTSVRPVGLCSLAAVLEKSGFAVAVYNSDMEPGAQVIDALSTTRNFKKYLSRVSDLNDPLWEEIRDTIIRYSPDVIGVTVLTAKYKSALILAGLIRSVSPKIKIIAGGVHPSICPGETLKTGLYDIVVRGEGEYTMVELVNALIKQESLANIKGISYRDKGKIIHNLAREAIQNLDDLPHPGNHLILNNDKMLPDDFGHIMATRGCPYGCIFCASHKIWGRTVRYRSVKNIVDEIQKIKNIHSPVFFTFQDDSFSINYKFVEELCELMIKENLKIRWICETRADLVSNDLIKLMRRAGCFRVILGVESGSVVTLLRIKKQLTKERVRQAVKICKANHMETSIYLMIGFPWETEKEVNDTVSFMEELKPRNAVFSIATPYPGTELYDICRNENLISKDPDWEKFFHQSPDMFLSNKLSKEQTTKIIEDAEKRFVKYNRKKHRLRLLNPLVLFLALKKFYKQPKELFRKVKYFVAGVN